MATRLFRGVNPNNPLRIAHLSLKTMLNSRLSTQFELILFVLSWQSRTNYKFKLNALHKAYPPLRVQVFSQFG